jgi:2'-5' RNA ligase
MDETTTLIYPGGAIKALGDGKFEGPLVRFSAPDLDNNYFDAKTDFGFEGRKSIETAIYYHHALDGTVKKTRIGTGTLTLKKDCVWLEGQLKKRRRYVTEIGELMEKGALGLSSGTAPHLVEPANWTKGGRISMWPLGLDASLTPTPADPGTFARAVKSTALQVPSFEELCRTHAVKSVKAEDDEDLDLSDDVDEPPARSHQGLFVALYPSADVASRVALEGGESADQLHVTLAYCGDAGALDPVAIAQAVVNTADVARQLPVLAGHLNGIGRFAASPQSDGRDVLWAAVDVPGLAGARDRVARYLSYAGCPARGDHGWAPHMTLAYLDPTADSPITRLEPVAVEFSQLTIIFGDTRIDIPLGIRGEPAASLDWAKAVPAALRSALDEALAESDARRRFWDLESAFNDALREIEQAVEDGEAGDAGARVDELVADYAERLRATAREMIGLDRAAAADSSTKSSTGVGRRAGKTLDAQTQEVLAAVEGLTKRWTGLAERVLAESATKVGAAMSRSRRARVAATRDALREHADALDAVLTECEPKTKAAMDGATPAAKAPDLDLLKLRARARRRAA